MLIAQKRFPYGSFLPIGIVTFGIGFMGMVTILKAVAPTEGVTRQYSQYTDKSLTSQQTTAEYAAASNDNPSGSGTNVTTSTSVQRSTTPQNKAQSPTSAPVVPAAVQPATSALPATESVPEPTEQVDTPAPVEQAPEDTHPDESIISILDDLVTIEVN